MKVELDIPEELTAVRYARAWSVFEHHPYGDSRELIARVIAFNGVENAISVDVSNGKIVVQDDHEGDWRAVFLRDALEDGCLHDCYSVCGRGSIPEDWNELKDWLRAREPGHPAAVEALLDAVSRLDGQAYLAAAKNLHRLTCSEQSGLCEWCADKEEYERSK